MSTQAAATSPRDCHALGAGCNALGHPLRLALLYAIATEDELSPVQLAGLIEPEVALTVVAYHVRRLERAGFIELSRTTPVRGALEHHYRITAVGRTWLEALDSLR